MNISKELLSEVLENEVVKFKIVSTKRITQIRIWYKDTEWHMYESWDIYHLAHKCKEWALSKGHYISLIIDEDDKTKCRYVLNLSWNDGYEVDFVLASEPYDTETEAIFKACEYIMENKCGR